jgi:glycerol-3-phosphate dehydrogenase
MFSALRLSSYPGRRTIELGRRGACARAPAPPRRPQMLAAARNVQDFDLIIIGGGATGSGAALDAAKRGMRVLCVEREDFASATSSRSTKLLWGGSRYLVQALVSLFNFDLRLLRSPVQTVRKFMEEFKMVLNCHRERTFMMLKQPHLTHWLPIAVPLDRWFIWPPPFAYPPAALGPLGLFPLFFKFYDALSGFNCPPSHVMNRQRALRKFPQLANNLIKYCSVFYEGMHDDARTNLAVAQTAAKEGAIILNYAVVTRFLRASDGNNKSSTGQGDADGERVLGVCVRDAISGEEFQAYGKSILFCAGPFTDDLRRLEDPQCKPAVTGAAGIHIVLPSYFAPQGIGLVDMSTSDGRFLFFLPWLDHVLVGTTDHKVQPSMRPVPEETV